MHIHFGRSNGYIQSIELTQVSHHKALPHINKLLSENGYSDPIHKIQVENSVVNNEDYAALQTIFHQCKALNEIKLNSNHIDSEHMYELFSALPGKQLMSISFTDNWIGEKIPNNFFEFMLTQQSIQFLDFSLNWLGDSGIIKLVDSISHNVHRLQLSCDDFQVEGLIAIRHFILQCSQLSELDISYNNLDANSAKQIAGIIGESDCISSIKANSNQFGDKGAALIADALKYNDKMINLDVSDNGISNIGAKDLVKSVSKKAVMRQLDLRHNPINPDEIDQITRAMAESHPLIEVLV